MATAIRLNNFCGPTYRHRSIDVDAEQCINLYPEKISGPGAKSDYILIGTPGRKVWLRFSPDTPGGIRGVFNASTGRTFVVASDTLFWIYIPAGTPVGVRIGNIGSLTSPVEMIDNGTDLIIADSQILWRYNFDDETLTSVSNSPSNPTHLAYINGRIYCNDSEVGGVRYSELNDAATWPSLNVFKSEGSPDPLQAIAFVSSELWAFNSSSYEVYRPSGDADNPLARAGGSWTGIGIKAPNSIAQLNDTLFWVGGGKDGRNIIFMASGYSAVRISDHSIEYAMGQMSTVSDAIGFSYMDEGHWFYVLQFPSGNKTFVYDLTTSQWHERCDRTKRTNIFTRWRPTMCAMAFDKLLCGDYSDSVIYDMDLDYHTDEEWDDETGTIIEKPIRRVRQTGPEWDNMKPVLYTRFMLDCEVGVGDLTGDASDPQAMLQWSDDGGHTWSNERWTSMGKTGKYGTLPSWNMLGKTRKRSWRVTISASVRVVLIGATLYSERTIGP